MDPAPGTLIGEKFRIVRTLGKGGMGVVYEVVHELTKHHRALKLLHADIVRDHPDIVRRFLREASVAGTLGDPRIVETFDAGQLSTGEPYLVMELLAGETLAARIERAQLPIADAVAIAREVAAAMAVAHDKGITHRDLKPENIFLTKASVKVLDFGISKFAPEPGSDAASTREGVALGTPYYMAPEQLRAERDLDGRVDVYAIGVLLYEALAGRRPFDAPTMSALVVKISEGDMIPLTTFRSDTPPALAALISRTMHRDRGVRVQSARELADLLGAVDLAAIDVLAATAPLSDGLALAATAPVAVPPTPGRPPWIYAAAIALPAAGLAIFMMTRAQPAVHATEAPSATPVTAPTPVAAPAPSPAPSPALSVSTAPSVPKPKPSASAPKSKHADAGLTENPL